MTDEPKVIYIVTSGAYSDYGIEAAFSTKEAAEAYIQAQPKTFSTDRYNIEEYFLDCPEGRDLWAVAFDAKGDVSWVSHNGKSQKPPVVAFWESRIARGVWVSIAAKTKTQAIKAAAERRAQFLYEEESLKEAR